MEFESIMWSKLIINLLNAPHALTNSPYHHSFTNEAFRALVVAAIKEGIRICHENHVGLKSSLITPFLENLHQSQEEIEEWISNHPVNVDLKHYVSTHKSILEGKRSDIEYLTGEIVNLGNRFSTLVNSFLLDEVRKMDLLNAKKERIEYYTPSSLLEKLQEKIDTNYLLDQLNYQL